jgi:hypothetical protein
VQKCHPQICADLHSKKFRDEGKGKNGKREKIIKKGVFGKLKSFKKI